MLAMCVYYVDGAACSQIAAGVLFGLIMFHGHHQKGAVKVTILIIVRRS